MNTWKKALVIGLVLAFTTASMFAQGQGEKINLKLGYSSPESNPWHVCAQELAKYVSDNTNGNVTVSIFPAEVLGSDKQMAEMLKMGTLDMHICPQGVASDYEPNLAALGLPFLFDSNEQAAKLLDGPIGMELVKELPEKQGMRALAYWENGMRQTTNNLRPINTPADLKGMKIRTPNDKMTISIYKALGANPAPLAYSELYMALSQGVFDGQENPVVNIHASKLYEVQKYMSFTNHKYECKVFMVSEATWKKLSPEYQQVITDAAKKFAIENRAMFAQQDKQLRDDLVSKGMILNTPDLIPFRKSTIAVYDEWRKTLGADLVNRVVETAQAK